MDRCIRIELFGGLRLLVAGSPEVVRFRTQKVAGLLAYLAFHLGRSIPREILIEAFWPETDPDLGRHDLRNALSSLRHHLEPPNTGSVLLADATSVRLDREAVTTDVEDFREALRQGRAAVQSSDRLAHLERAVSLVQGTLLPGRYEDWAVVAQEEIAETFFQSVHQLLVCLEELGEVERAILFARKAVVMDPLREESVRDLMRVYGAAGKPHEALRLYRDTQARLKRDLSVSPESPTRHLAEDIARQVGRQDRQSLPDAPSGTAVSSGTAGGTVTLLLADAPAGKGGDLQAAFAPITGQTVKESGHCFALSFPRTADALDCAVSASAKDRSGTLRMAVHVGEVDQERGDASSGLLHRASLLLSAAHPGQVLCSEEAAALLRRHLKEGWRLRDLGRFYLESVGEPERLFQVCFAGDSPERCPPPSARPVREGGLPHPLTSFIGRETEMARVREMVLSGMRLVSLTGPGGCGKTRLAIECARGLWEVFRGAVWYIPLANLSDPAHIPDAIRSALRIPSLTETLPLEQVMAVLGEQRSLIVLDNFEHLVNGGACIVQELLTGLPELAVLVTTRQTLNLTGERELPVPPLPIHVNISDLSTLSRCESVRLFVDRAQGVRPDFQVTSSNAESLATLCARLEGIPLSLELAAARVAVLSPTRMLEQMEHRLEVLVSHRRDVEPRHRSLRAAIEWSYRLLSPAMQQFFRRLSVFRGGWTAEAAAFVCEEERSLDFLEELRESSLVQSYDSESGIRFRMLETLRDYANEQRSDEERWSVRGRHRDYFLQMAEEAAPELPGALQSEWFERLEAEKSNFREALAFGREDPEGGEARLTMVGCLAPFWAWSGYVREGWDEVHAVLADSPAGKTTRGRALALLGAAWLDAVVDCKAEARTAMLEESVMTLRKTGPAWATVWALQRLAAAIVAAGERGRGAELSQEALDLCRRYSLDAIEPWLLLGWSENVWYSCFLTTPTAEALEVARRTGNKAAEASALKTIGWQKMEYSELEGACALIEEALTICRSLRDRRILVETLRAYSQVRRALGDYVSARAAVEEALATARSMGSTRLAFPLLEAIGNVAREQCDFDAARRYYEEALATASSIGHVEDGTVLHDLGRVLTAQGDLSGGRALLWKAVELNRSPGPRSPQIRWREANGLLILGYIALWEGNLEEARRLLTEGMRIWVESSPEYYMPLYVEAFGWLASAEQDFERSARLCGAADQLREMYRYLQAPEDRPSHDTALTAAREALGDERFEAAWAQGRAMSLEQAIACALGEGPAPPP